MIDQSATCQFGKNNLGDRNEFLPTVAAMIATEILAAMRACTTKGLFSVGDKLTTLDFCNLVFSLEYSLLLYPVTSFFSGCASR